MACLLHQNLLLKKMKYEFPNVKVKIIEDKINQEHKLVIYDFGFCWNVPKDKHHLIELSSVFEDSDRNPKKTWASAYCYQ